MELNSVDLAAQAAVGYPLQLVHPATGEKLDGIITIRGDESKEVQAYNRRRFMEMQKRERMNKSKNNDFTAAELEDLAVENAIVRVIGWKNIKKDGKDLDFNRENADMVLRDYPWIRKQVTEAAEDLSLFLPE